MRPIRLEVEGFSTFRQSTVLDFRDLDLVALTGSTGAGKSTVIDAMTFALYGSVARYGNTGVVEPVIHQLSTEAKVRFDFEVGGSWFVATRVTRRQHQRATSVDGASNRSRSKRATTKEARLEQVIHPAAASATDTEVDFDAVETEVLAGAVKELDAAVVDLLGLTFSQFTRTVVLPQGEFANFLRDEPTKRQDLLKRLLDLELYGRMGSEARRRADAADQQVITLRHELDRLAAPDDTQIKALDLRAAGLTAIRKKATGWLGDINALDEVLEPLRGQAAQLQSDIDALAAIAVPSELETLAGAAVAAEDEVTRALDLATKATDALETARRNADQLGDRRLLLETRHHLQQASDAEGKLAELTQKGDELETALAEANVARDEAEARRSKLVAELATARRNSDGAHLADDLAVGDTCPVCRQAVGELPVHSSAEADLVPELEQSLTDVSADVDRHGQAAAAATAQLTSIATQRSELTELMTTVQARAGVDVGSGPTTGEEVDELLAKIDQAGVDERELADAVATAERAVARARADVDRTRTQADEGRQDFGRQRDTVSPLSPPEAGFDSLLDDWTALADWAVGRRGELVTERETLVADGRRKRTERDELVARLTEALGQLDINITSQTAVQALELISVADADLRAERQRADELLAHAKRLTADIEDRKSQQQLNKELGRHLSAKGFEAWLLAEAFDDITERATSRLLELSGGRYSLAAVERDIAIVDHHNADEHRIARTLSGGETFLASLALALALADSIAALAPVDAPRLESMFLDEGFGTLDPDTLDVVAGAIEELAASGRMIGIVTHVRDLAERMPARFEIKKLPTGSTAELVTL